MHRIVASLLLALGLLGAGWLLGQGVAQSRLPRFVNVKGLAERDVRADLALWSLRFAEAGDDLPAAQSALAHDHQAILAFLARHGLDASSVQAGSVQVTDRAAQNYGGNGGRYSTRFVVTETLLVRSGAVDAVQAAAQAAGELAQAGVALGAEYDQGAPVYLYNGLNALKPALIAEATANARQAAAQFADNCGCRLGGIVRADQGVVEILARDKAPMLQPAQQPDKTVRVVVSVGYALKG